MTDCRSVPDVSVEPRKRTRRAGSSRLDRDDWIKVARQALIDGGVASVKIVLLAEVLGATSGSFYWHFADRSELLAALLLDWEVSNTLALVEAASGDADPQAKFERVVDMWLREDDFDPKYDSAVRDWSRGSPAVEAAVHRVDSARIEILRRIFVEMGDRDPKALARAQIAYYHQVGYYAMRVQQPKEARRALRGVYLELLTGRPAKKIRQAARIGDARSSDTQ